MVAIAIDRARSESAGSDRPTFYVWMAGIFVLLAFTGFIPTYFAKVASGTFGGAPVLHIHGALFFTWTLFFLMQTVLVASGRTPDHRAWGMAGIALATAMACTVVLAAINSMRVAGAIGMADEARRFSFVSLTGVTLFAGFLTLAMVFVKRSEIHKRLMLLTMIPLVHAAMGRVFLTLFAPPNVKGPPPVFVSVPPGLAVDLLIVVALVYDWRTRGRPHPVYLVGGALLIADQVLAVPLSATPTWLSIATWVQSLAG